MEYRMLMFVIRTSRARLWTKQVSEGRLMDQAPQIPAGVDTNRPTPARIYDYMLQGSNFFAADRMAAEQILKAAPEIRDAAWSNRGFHQRAARWIAQQGVRQFIDIGSGLPTVGNTHEVVQKVVPEAHVVYVDNDPMVELHSRALLDSGGMSALSQGPGRSPSGALATVTVHVGFGR
jgi:hypothetical protein